MAQINETNWVQLSISDSISTGRRAYPDRNRLFAIILYPRLPTLTHPSIPKHILNWGSFECNVENWMELIVQFVMTGLKMPNMFPLRNFWTTPYIWSTFYALLSHGWLSFDTWTGAHVRVRTFADIPGGYIVGNYKVYFFVARFTLPSPRGTDLLSVCDRRVSNFRGCCFRSRTQKKNTLRFDFGTWAKSARGECGVNWTSL